MISGVLTALLGESLLFHSTRLVLWFLLFFFINYVYFVFSEEPGLMKRFGREYLEYRENVPRWIPRLKPWIPATRVSDGKEKWIQSVNRRMRKNHR